jgi:hypothetical protein
VIVDKEASKEKEIIQTTTIIIKEILVAIIVEKMVI